MLEAAKELVIGYPLMWGLVALIFGYCAYMAHREG